ncbi:MAG: alpha-1,4-glucan--maltose-1-phosphate maltosyltransferase [Gemmatimonadota bacterium]|jgi:starch synthase (maltosyl-transferring)
MRPTRDGEAGDLGDAMSRRVWVRNLQPSVDDGEFAVKRTVGETVEVSADIFADGHDRVAAVVRWRPASDDEWTEVPMRPAPNDVWTAAFVLRTQEPCHLTVSAWIDRFATWRSALEKKFEAGQDVASELLEGAAMIDATAGRAAPPDRAVLRSTAERLGGDAPQAERVERALADDLLVLMRRWDPRDRITHADHVQTIEVGRERARFGAWYEMFPRSEGPDPSRSATFAEAESRLPAIAAMGFDVLYLPPIHPIGRTNRKGRNNSLGAGPGDPGSPWAIGGPAGGHKAVHPDLGTLEDFDRFAAHAADVGLEVALDLAFQCSPDHPWVREHPEWFRHRPDGTIKHAENPPKMYEDIYPLDFDCDAWRELWHALKSVVEFWIERGVRVFRVDNPHTKPLRFWGWLIREIKAEHPDVIFLSEAFTRPKVMYTLAKLGFDQSYTYFTWRNTRMELTEYMTELTRTGVRDFFRPNLWANTPDILPEYLQFGNRAAFQSRAVLAATLAASYGIYSGYELCENQALPGREEYHGSEKYELRHRDWNRPGNISEWIARINRIRRENPALAYDHRLCFHPCDNDEILFYGKSTEDLSNIIMVAVNLDPHHVQDGFVEVPIHELGIDDRDTYQVHDLIGEGRYLWHGARNYVRLDPASAPAQIFRVRRRVRTERDFDYFL